jgi:hypothetical protein
VAGIKQCFAELAKIARPVSIAQVGGFRPPEDPLTSWFGRGVCLASEPEVSFNGQALFPLLQVRVSELPEVPKALEGIALLVVYMNAAEVPYDKAHGDGWLVREYRTLEGLAPCPTRAPKGLKSLPIKWVAGKPERPDWEQANELLNLEALEESDSARERFDKLPHHGATKIGGYPSEIQSLVENAGDYVLQIGSEEKAHWQWGDNGIATFARDAGGAWTFECQTF